MNCTTYCWARLCSKDGFLVICIITNINVILNKAFLLLEHNPKVLLSLSHLFNSYMNRNVNMPKNIPVLRPESPTTAQDARYNLISTGFTLCTAHWYHTWQPHFRKLHTVTVCCCSWPRNSCAEQFASEFLFIKHQNDLKSYFLYSISLCHYVCPIILLLL